MKHLQDKIRLRRTGQQVVAAVRACFFPVSAGLALRHSPPTNTATTRPPPTATAPTVLWSRPEVVGGAMASWHPDEHLPRSAWPSPKPSQAVFCPLSVIPFLYARLTHVYLQILFWDSALRPRPLLSSGIGTACSVLLI